MRRTFSILWSSSDFSKTTGVKSSSNRGSTATVEATATLRGRGRPTGLGPWGCRGRMGAEKDALEVVECELSVRCNGRFLSEYPRRSSSAVTCIIISE